MAATIKIKNSSTAGAAPTSSDLVQGELAVNVTDKRLYTENASGTIVELGTNPSVPVTFPDGSASAPSLTNDGDTNTGLFFPAADTVGIATGGSERARIDSSGNLGLGVTPSAWDSSAKAIQVGSFVGLSGFTDYMDLSTNSYYGSGSYRYLNSSRAATTYAQTAGQHRWYNAPSGTAGNTITFTQAMTLDASGNLGIGTTSPSAKIHVQAAAPANTPSVLVDETTNGYAIRMGIDSSGLGWIGSTNATVLAFKTNGSERARIDTSGNLLVGKTSTSQSAGGSVLYGGGTNGAYFTGVASQAVYVNRETSDGTVIDIRRSASTVGTISVTTSSTAYNTSSDYRLKHDISPMTGALAKVAALKPCTYKWNADGSDGEGFIAHELAEVVPHAVTGAKDAVDENGNPVYQGIDTSFLVATLTAALQELKAEFDAYKATHP